MSDISEQSNYDENICIICLEELDNDKIFIQPCNCKNKVHADCLLTWIQHKNSIECEICKSDYEIPEYIINNFINNNYYSNCDYNNSDNIEIEISESDESVSDDEQENNNRYAFQNYNICRKAIVYYVMIILPIACLSFIIILLIIFIQNSY